MYKFDKVTGQPSWIMQLPKLKSEEPEDSVAIEDPVTKKENGVGMAPIPGSPLAHEEAMVVGANLKHERGIEFDGISDF